MSQTAILLYDGTCGFCAASVQWVLRHERTHTLCFAPLDSALGRSVRVRHPHMASVDSVLWIDRSDMTGTERVFVKSDAALRIARYVGGPWRWGAMIAQGIPRVIRDAAYDLIARQRHRLIPGTDACWLPRPEDAERFLA